jgi:superfamily II DNA or RNA helicase
MSAKARVTALRSVRTPDGLAALRRWLAGFPADVRERGRHYFERGHVQSIRSAADHYVEAIVTGSDSMPSTTTLFYTRGQWSSDCTCSHEDDCRHAYAAGLAWLAHVESGAVEGVDPAKISSHAPPPKPEPTPLTFRQQWTPVLASKLGRVLSDDEARQLDELAALFAELTQAHGTLYPGALLRHGFDYTPPPGAPLYKPAYAGWWDDTTAPRDPWALWQYIAYDYELAGRPIPEVFQPLTNTAQIRAVIDERLANNELAAWRRALAAADEPATARTHPALVDVTGLRARIHHSGELFVEIRTGAGKAWKSPAKNWFIALASTRPADFEHLTPPEAALGNALAAESRGGSFENAPSRRALPAEIAENVFRTRAARDAIVLPNGAPLVIEPAPLLLDARIASGAPDRLALRLTTPDGRDASDAALVTQRPAPLYVFEDRVWHGPPPTPDAPLPKTALADTRLMSRLRAAGLRLPRELEQNIRRIVLRPHLKLWLTPTPGDDDAMDFHAQLLARADAPPIEQHWTAGGWQWTRQGGPPPRRPDDPFIEYDLSGAQAVVPRLTEFRLDWHPWEADWARAVTKNFPDEFIAWHATLPPGLAIETSPGLANLLGGPLAAHIELTAAPAPAAAGPDWFNLTAKLSVKDTKLTPEEISLLLKARGKWVRLKRHGWQRLEVSPADAATTSALDRLGLDASDVLVDGRPSVHRLHVLQLAAESDLLEARDAKLAAALRERALTLTALPPPPLPPGLRATLRPYQEEGFHFLAHLAALGLGGILADDMGLGKTVQTLAWLLHAAAEKSPLERGAVPRPGERGVSSPNPPADTRPFRALVVCPKSVVHGWLAETTRFAPALNATAFNPLRLGEQASSSSQRSSLNSQLLVANYTQLRLHASWFRTQPWDAVILDEGQFIKNPNSQVAQAARALQTPHRFVLTGTPIENRLTDLWSLFAFAQPGVLGTLTAFRRQYDRADAAALARLHRRIRHFLLRRTKAQAAPDLPPRTEDDLVVELEGEQRRLYDAELKRARAQLLGIETARDLVAVRFNVLNSLLRLRQICCHPALVDPAHRHLPSANLDALLEHLEELRDEGHQVLVFSQFVEMLELIRACLVRHGIEHLMLTGATENRGELVEQFQTDKTKTVFLLSLKAAGFGLNLTAASYAILYDPWWNPAAEAQAIDRTHRIGQTKPVIAYRLLAENTVEEKIRALQRDKAALASAVVQEESLASILDLDSLRQILG